MPTRNHRPTTRQRAVLLLGPTGSGKTPLGDLIVERGLWQAECLHFDFGANLRRIVERNRPDPLISRKDIDFLRQVLESGALLENEHFPIAGRVLRCSLAEHGADDRTLVILNGLPRHVGQAKAIDAILDVHAVVHLDCSRETALERIRANIGGDRTGRRDDDPPSIHQKLERFAEQTAPLLDHYRALGARLVTLDVTATMTADEMWERLAGRIS